MKLVVATANLGKVAEVRALLGGLPLELVSLGELDYGGQIEESGETFEENATAKALAAARASGLPALADDSGLEVEALGGAPGVRSARFAKDHGASGASDAANNRQLLQALRDIPPERRQARFRCVLALALPGGQVFLASGACVGRIAAAPRGGHGFGYDPLFEVDAMPGRTMAELSAEEKNRVSHRAQALGRMRAVILGHLITT